uniref:Uncharacterized protein n=1 Tax=Tanacetum cinerariifolium TaxID=118510 RepID=A0A6L2JCH5_TANCI|nr:hypothetical protein [Tanacetum cinerariifolium]
MNGDNEEVVDNEEKNEKDKMRLDHLKQDLRMLVIKRFRERNEDFRERKLSEKFLQRAMFFSWEWSGIYREETPMVTAGGPGGKKIRLVTHDLEECGFENICNNDKNLSEIQLEHEKEEELVVVVVKVVHKCRNWMNGGKGDWIWTLRGNGGESFWGRETILDEDEILENEKKSWNEMILHYFHQQWHPTDKMRMDDLEWWKRS